ncbi:MAG: beta-ketoacyl-ACP synthase II [Gemmataceae bacterium]
MKKRIVITGMGVITPLGHRPEAMFDALCAGKSGVGLITRFDASTFPTRIAAEVRDFDLARYLPSVERYRYSGPNTRFGLAAAREALADAGLLHNDKVDRSRIGVYLGCGEGTQDFNVLMTNVAYSYRDDTRAIDGRAFVEKGMELYRGTWEYEQELHTTPGYLAHEFDLEGPNYNCLTSCAAGNQAIGEALEILRQGEADVMVTGGTHSILHPLGVTGFCRLTALSARNDEPARASRPFDAKRDGFIMGEGAGLVILEELEHARRRGARIHAELTGYGVTADAFRLTDSHPEGRNAVLCMQEALADAGLAPRDIGYINAHGTSTQLNDRVETLAIKKAFGDHAHNVPISSTKSMMGHLIGAAGSVEAIICVLAIQRGLVPPTINYENPDPDCDLDYVPNQARRKQVEHTMSNSFGFGGQNVTLIVSKYAS